MSKYQIKWTTRRKPQGDYFFLLIQNSKMEWIKEAEKDILNCQELWEYYGDSVVGEAHHKPNTTIHEQVFCIFAEKGRLESFKELYKIAWENKKIDKNRIINIAVNNKRKNIQNVIKDCFNNKLSDDLINKFYTSDPEYLLWLLSKYRFDINNKILEHINNNSNEYTPAVITALVKYKDGLLILRGWSFTYQRNGELFAEKINLDLILKSDNGKIISALYEYYSSNNEKISLLLKHLIFHNNSVNCYNSIIDDNIQENYIDDLILAHKYKSKKIIEQYDKQWKNYLGTMNKVELWNKLKYSHDIRNYYHDIILDSELLLYFFKSDDTSSIYYFLQMVKTHNHKEILSRLPLCRAETRSWESKLLLSSCENGIPLILGSSVWYGLRP